MDTFFESAFLQTVTAGLCVILGAIAGAWWSASTTARTAAADRSAQAVQAEQDRKAHGDQATRDRLHENRSALMARLSAAYGEVTGLYLDLRRELRKMRRAIDDGDAPSFNAAFESWQQRFEQEGSQTQSKVADLHLHSSVYLEPETASVAARGYAMVDAAEEQTVALAASHQDAQRAGGVSAMPALLRLADARTEQVHQSGNHVRRLFLLLGKVQNPSMGPLIDRELGP